MIVVALVAIAALAVSVVAFLNVIRAMQRQHDRERELILNQLLHATGNTWSPPPVPDLPPPAEPAELYTRVTASPERFT